MSGIPTQAENPKGLHARYHIQKVRLRTEDEMQAEADERFAKLPERFRKGEIEVAKYEHVDTDPGSEYFVLRLDEGGKDLNHIRACRIGINAYADAIAPFIPELAKDLKERYPLIP